MPYGTRATTAAATHSYETEIMTGGSSVRERLSRCMCLSYLAEDTADGCLKRHGERQCSASIPDIMWFSSSISIQPNDSR